MQNNPNMEKDDMHHAPILVVYGQIAEALQEEFSIYLPLVFPHVLRALNISIDAKIEETLTNNKVVSGKGKEKI